MHPRALACSVAHKLRRRETAAAEDNKSSFWAMAHGHSFGLPPLEGPVMIAEKRKLSFSFQKQQERTKRHPQVAWHKCKVDDLGRDPQRPQRLAAVPDLIAPLVVCVLQRVGLPFYQALDCVEGGEIHEGVTAWTDICVSMSSVSQLQEKFCGVCCVF